ncbi:helix-turn-helix domain-containing protein [Streptomyces clavifer]|uniref:helix-turn-helix domain-containing protein n=1 Tax=Streptomyces clavifer TaxID=68188 RepID=UPI00339E444E
MTDADTPDVPGLRPPKPRVLSANQLVSYNLMRARRTHGWTQQDVADLLQQYTGRTWSNASVSAAERAWQGGRPRRFDASELVAFSKIFDEPLAYFFLPVEEVAGAKWVGMQEFPDGQPNLDPDDKRNDLMAIVPTADLIRMAGIPHNVPADFTARIQELSVRWLGLVWTPPEWRSAIREYRSMDEVYEDWRVGDADPDAWPNEAYPRGVQVSGDGKEVRFTVTKEELRATVDRVVENLIEQMRTGGSSADRGDDDSEE